MRQEMFEQTLFDMSQLHESSLSEAKDSNGTSQGTSHGDRSEEVRKIAPRRKETSYKHRLTFEYLLRHVPLPQLE